MPTIGDISYLFGTSAAGSGAKSSTAGPLGAGSYTYAVSFTGDSNYNPISTAVNEPLQIDKGTPTITTTPGVICSAGNGQFATIGFWHNCNGQALICGFNGSSSSKSLGNWLANNWPNLFGSGSNSYTGCNLAGLTNAQVAAVYENLWTPNGLPKNTYVQAFAVALGLYSTGGLGSYNVGSNGAAFGVANNTTPSVTQILNAVNANFSPSAGTFYGGDSTNTGCANNVLNGINCSGESPCGCTIVCCGASLIDSASVTGYSPTGPVTFYLFAPGVTPNSSYSNNVYNDTATVNGTAPARRRQDTCRRRRGLTSGWPSTAATATTTRSPAPSASEPWTVGTASPTTISTTPNVTAVTLGTTAVTLKDTADLEGRRQPDRHDHLHVVPGRTPWWTRRRSRSTATASTPRRRLYAADHGHGDGDLPVERQLQRGRQQQRGQRQQRLRGAGGGQPGDTGDQYDAHADQRDVYPRQPSL